MDWKDGGLYLVPSNGGKAIGFIYRANDASEQGSKHAELKIAKIPQEILTDGDGKGSVVHFSTDDAAPYPSWAKCLRERCRDILESEGTQSLSDELPTSFYSVGASSNDALMTAFREAEFASIYPSSNN